MAKRRGTSTAGPEQSIWPHLIVGFVLGAVAVHWLGGEPAGLGAAGAAGAGLAYVVHCWQHPLVRCWWPGWFWLGWFGLRGCQGRATTSGKYYGVKPRCPLHPNSSVYVRPVARVLPTKRKPPKVKP